MTTKNLEGTVAVVTGGARGIGLSIAKALAEKGSNIAVWDVLEDAAKEAVSELEGMGVKAHGCVVDVTDINSVEVALKSTVESLGKIGILVNNAGITRDNILLRMDEKDWDLVMNVNLKGAFLCSKLLAKHMRKTGGSVVNIASVVGMIGNAGQANYSASKAGLIGLTKTSARELARYNIRVNAVAPGFIDTAMTQALSEEHRKALTDDVPLGRFGSSEDVAAAVSFLAGSESSYVTGQVIRVCGGMVM